MIPLGPMPERLALLVRDGTRVQSLVRLHPQNVTLSIWVFWSYYIFVFPSRFPLWFSINWAEARGGLLYYARHGLDSSGEMGQGYGQNESIPVLI